MAEKHTLQAKREQEERERQHRKRDLIEAEAKKRAMEELMHSREEQIRAKEYFMALQSRQDREEFERVLAAQQDITQQESEKLEQTAVCRFFFLYWGFLSFPRHPQNLLCQTLWS